MTTLSSLNREFCWAARWFFQIGALYGVLERRIEMMRLRAALVALVTALVTAIFVVPRPHTPSDVPYPPVDSDRTRVEHIEVIERARHASLVPLHVDVRGIGERVRRVSLLEVQGDSEAYRSERARLRTLVHDLLRARREQELLQLRDLQAVLFVNSLKAHWQNPTAETEVAIAELGAKVPSYLDGSSTWSQKYSLLEPTLIAFFCVRWAELLDVQQHLLLAASANAHRLIHRFLVSYQLERGAKRDHHQLLALLAAVPQYSPQYPAEYSRGIVFYQMGAFPEAVTAFERHLMRHPDGAWAVRAHNFRLESIRASTQ